jgi:hypothetical protein
MKPRRIRESKVESYLVKEVEKRGGVAEKFKSPGRRNVPDRIISWPETIFPRGEWAPYPGWVEFVECKRPGEKPTPAQHRDHERRRAMGFRVTVVDSIEAVDTYLESNIR